MEVIYLLLAVTIIGIGIIVWQNSRRSKLDVDPKIKADLERKIEENGELKNQISELKSKNDELTGKGKQLYDNYKDLESNLKIAKKDLEEKTKQLSQHEAQKTQQLKRHEDGLTKLDSAKAALEDEKARIRKEDDERLQKLEEERDRIWGEHEENVVSLLTDLCKKAQYSFTSYDNNNLPENFSGKYKPDFMIEFLKQYVVFDAKVSKSSSVQNYIAESVKKTAQKIKGNDLIYPVVFLVVPTHAVTELKKYSYYEEGFTFYIISPESCEPILASFKKLENYEFAKEIDPRDRENIIDALAHMDFHIATRNAFDYRLMEEGFKTQAKMRNLNEDYQKEVLIKRGKIRHLNLNTAENRELISDPDIVEEKLHELTEPTPKLKQEEIDSVK